MDVELRVVKGDSMGATIHLHGPRLVIGLSPVCQIRLMDLSVAEQHCELLIRGTQLGLRDLGSVGGTMLNGLRMAPDCVARARPGDRIGVGSAIFEVVLGDPNPGTERDGAASVARRLLQQWLGPSRPLSPRERKLVCTRDVAGIPVHAIDLPGITAPAAIRVWRSILRGLADRASPGRLVLDLRAVHECSVEAVDVLLAFHHRLNGAGGTVKVCDARPSVLRVFEVTEADRVIRVFRDASDAVWSRW